jgi:putative transposase
MGIAHSATHGMRCFLHSATREMRWICMPNFNLTRKLIRKRNFNYSKDGWYFLTICANKQIDYFGCVQKEKMILNDCGQIIEKYLLQIPHFYDASLPCYVIMPDHLHFVLWMKSKILNFDANTHRGITNFDANTHRGITNFDANTHRGITNFDANTHRGTGNARSLHEISCYGLVSKIINSFKNVCTKDIRRFNPNFSWQKSFYDRIIRTDVEAYMISRYIEDNPKNWGKNKNDIKFNQL